MRGKKAENNVVTEGLPILSASEHRKTLLASHSYESMFIRDIYFRKYLILLEYSINSIIRKYDIKTANYRGFQDW